MSRDVIEHPASSGDHATIGQPTISQDQEPSGEPAVPNNRRRRRVIVRRLSPRRAVSALPARASNLPVEVIEISSKDDSDA